jgi:O-antigen ligase
MSCYFAMVPGGAFIGLKRFLLYFIFYGMMVKINDKEIIYKMLFSILFVFTAISIYEIALYIIRFPEASKFSNLGEIRLYSFAFFLTTGEMKMLLFLTMFPLLFIKDKILFPKKYLIISLSIIFVSMYLTQSRNVFVAVVVSLIIFGAFLNKKFLIYLFIFIAVVLLALPVQLRQRVTSIFDPAYGSNESRLVMWNVGWEIFKDHPLTGVGDNEITSVYRMYRIPTYHGEGSHLHSNYFMILATKGIFGMIFYAAIFIALFLKHFKYFKTADNKADKYLIFGCIMAMISFHISGIFEWIYGDWEILTLFLFIVSIPFVLNNINSISKENNNLKL